jgi:hypothetical protein
MLSDNNALERTYKHEEAVWVEVVGREFALAFTGLKMTRLTVRLTC